MKSVTKEERPSKPLWRGKSVISTKGLPKGINPQGSRGLHSTSNANPLGREPGSTKGQEGNRAGLTRIKAETKLSGLYKKSEKFGDELKVNDIYKKFMLDRNLHLIAYDKLKSKPGNMTPGISPETQDGISNVELEKIIDKLRTEKFQFSPSRRVYIPKKDGGKRPLSVGNPRDKIVQEVMRMILEAMYEPKFKDSSHGFRINRGCHTALRTIFSKFHGV